MEYLALIATVASGICAFIALLTSTHSWINDERYNISPRCCLATSMIFLAIFLVIILVSQPFLGSDLKIKQEVFISRNEVEYEEVKLAVFKEAYKISDRLTVLEGEVQAIHKELSKKEYLTNTAKTNTNVKKKSIREELDESWKEFLKENDYINDSPILYVLYRETYYKLGFWIL